MSAPDSRTVCCAGVMKSGDHAVFGGLLPHRSTRWSSTPSRRSLFVTGDDHSPWRSRCTGALKLSEASGVTVAEIAPAVGVPTPAGQLQRVCWSHVNATLFRG